jgi:phenylacetate-coenzyme A ligase PaaK-like adenylate-forming protein
MCVSPHLFLRLIQYAESNGIDYKSSSIKTYHWNRRGITRSETLTSICLGQRIKEKMGCFNYFATYSSTENGSDIL